MKDLDLKPDEYRKQDPQTGRWLHNVDKNLARWMAIVGLGLLVVIAFTAGAYAHPVFVLLAGLVGAAAGASLILSLNRPDW